MAIDIIPILSDNYAYLLVDEATNNAAIVDPGEAAPILSYLENRGVNLTTILCTHKHEDHVAGVEEIYGAFPDLVVYGPKRDEAVIPQITRPLVDGDTVDVGNLKGKVLETPCHTSGDLSVYFPVEGAVFTGDTLFVGGCGRFFEGTAADMFSSLEKLSKLPDETKVYCGHEYTLSNLKFALSVEPKNDALKQKMSEVELLREQGSPSIPTSIGTEKAINPFMRSDSKELIENVRKQMPSDANDPIAILRDTRALKDNF